MVELKFLALVVVLAGVATLFFSTDVENWLDSRLGKWGFSAKKWVHPTAVVVTVVAFTALTLKAVLDASVLIGAFVYLYFWRKKAQKAE